MGAVLYTMVAGRSPFEHLTALHELLQAHRTVEPAPPSAFAPQHLPFELEAVILRALAKRPDDRFQTAQEFSDALARAVRPRSQRWARTEPLLHRGRVTPRPAPPKLPPPPALPPLDDPFALPFAGAVIPVPPSADDDDEITAVYTPTERPSRPSGERLATLPPSPFEPEAFTRSIDEEHATETGRAATLPPDPFAWPRRR
jgi:serine/threonine protein kinase